MNSCQQNSLNSKKLKAAHQKIFMTTVIEKKKNINFKVIKNKEMECQRTAFNFNNNKNNINCITSPNDIKLENNNNFNNFNNLNGLRILENTNSKEMMNFSNNINNFNSMGRKINEKSNLDYLGSMTHDFYDHKIDECLIQKHRNKDREKHSGSYHINILMTAADNLIKQGFYVISNTNITSELEENIKIGSNLVIGAQDRDDLNKKVKNEKAESIKSNENEAMKLNQYIKQNSSISENESSIGINENSNIGHNINMITNYAHKEKVSNKFKGKYNLTICR